MKRPAATLLALLLFSTALFAGKGPAEPARPADSLSSLYLYTEGIKALAIRSDSVKAEELFREAVRRDTSFAPAYYALTVNALSDNIEESVEMARRAHTLDTANHWYHNHYGYSLISAGRYKEALGVYRDLQATYPKEPDHYRLLAALYEATGDPYMALTVLDSAELRFGRIPYLSRHKRHLLLSTHQTGRAVEEARALVESSPYDAENRVELAEMYALDRKDSLAQAEFDAALRIDSMSVETLLAIADFHTSRQRWPQLLATMQRLYTLDDYPVGEKVRRFEQLTADIRFYRQFYPQLDAMASTLAVRYPDNRQVIELYGGHLIASGDLERALAHYKLHLADEPPAETYYHTVADIESYLSRPDSALLYLRRAQERFPESASFHISEGGVHQRNNNIQAAHAAYRKALKLAATDSVRSVIHGVIGDSYHNEAERLSKSDRTLAAADTRRFTKKSYKAYDKSLALWPDNITVLNNYAYFLSLEERDLERALEMSTRATALEKNNPTYLDTHAWVLYKMGRLDEAKRAIQQAVAFDAQQSMELLVHYGDILSALGERFSAEIYWQKALEKGYDKTEIERRIEEQKKSRKQ